MSADLSSADPAAWVENYGDQLFRFALLRVRDRDVAEDLVQETLIAAMKARDRFTGGSSFRTWLIGIMKHKILDYFRSRQRTVLASELIAPGDREGAEDAFFDRHGQWRSTPEPWARMPDQVLEQKEFREALTRCIDKMPGSMARLFVLRDIEGMESEQICKLMEISPANLYTTLHRARLRMRQCLEETWFESGERR